LAKAYKEKTKNNRKRKRKKILNVYEERKMKDRTPTLNKSFFFFLRGKKIPMKRKIIREIELIILITLIPKNL